MAKGYKHSHSLEEAVANRVTPGNEDECWLWQGSTTDNGYGKVRDPVSGRTIRAHRASYELASGEYLHDNEVIMHSCDTPLCVNPYHLSRGSRAENSYDCVRKGRQRRGENHYTTKLTEEIVREIKQQYAKGILDRERWAEKLGISPYTVRGIQCNQRWKHISV